MLHIAVLNEDVSLVNGLIHLGCNVSNGMTVDFNGHTYTDLTALHISIFKKNPQITALMLQAEDFNSAMTMKCSENNQECWSPLQLALTIATEAKDKNSILVCICNFVHVSNNIKGKYPLIWCPLYVVQFFRM